MISNYISKHLSLSLWMLMSSASLLPDTKHTTLMHIAMITRTARMRTCVHTRLIDSPEDGQRPYMFAWVVCFAVVVDVESALCIYDVMYVVYLSHNHANVCVCYASHLRWCDASQRIEITTSGSLLTRALACSRIYALLRHILAHQTHKCSSRLAVHEPGKMCLCTNFVRCSGRAHVTA